MMVAADINRLVIGSSDDTPDIEYITGFRPVDAVVVLKSGRRQALVVPAMEYGRAVKAAPGTRVFTPEMLGLKGIRRRGLSQWTLGLLNEYGIRNVTVAPTFYYGVAERLKKSRIKINVSEGELFPERRVKTADEVRKIAEAQQAAVIAMRHAIALIGRSEIDHAGYLRVRGTRLTSEMVIDSVVKVLLDHHCSGKGTIVAGGRQGADPHETGYGRLKAGELIVIDIFPQNLKTGYWGDITRTVLRGSASPLQKRTYNAVRSAQSAALALLKPGISGRRIHRAVCAEFEKKGFPVSFPDNPGRGFTHGTGHSVGLSIHENPGISNAPGRLRAGNVVTVEPGYYDPELGGCRIEDTVAVTAQGWKYLVPCEKRLEI